MPRTNLEKSLAALQREIERAPDPAQAKPAPLSLTSVPHRDAEHRLLFTIITRADGKRFKRTPIRDEEQRVIETVTEELLD